MTVKGRPRRPGERRRVPAAVGGETGAELSAFAALARAEAKAALAALIEIMGDREASPSARIAAAGAVLNWGFGSGSEEAIKDAPTEMAIRWLTPEEAERRGAGRGSKS